MPNLAPPSIAAIKIAQKEAGLSDQAYRGLLYRLTGLRSSTQLDQAQRRLALTELRKRIPRAARKSPAERKIWALWYDLRQYLPDVQRDFPYLLGFIHQANGGPEKCPVTKLSQLDQYQAQRAIEALKNRLLAEKLRT